MLSEAKEILKVVGMNINTECMNRSDSIFRPKSKSGRFQNILNDLDEHLQLTGDYHSNNNAKFIFITKVHFKDVDNYSTHS